MRTLRNIIITMQHVMIEWACCDESKHDCNILTVTVAQHLNQIAKNKYQHRLHLNE